MPPLEGFAMKRRAFLQSLLAGTAALTLPKSVEAVTRETDGRTLEERRYEFELHGKASHFGFQVTVPGNGRAVVSVQIHEGFYVQAAAIAVHVRDGKPPVMVEMPSTFMIPVPSSVLAEASGPLESPVFHHDLPLELTLEGTAPEDSDVVVALFLHCFEPGTYDPVTHLGGEEIS
jgi:hypothetical protein